MSQIHRLPDSGPWGETFGYSRAVRRGAAIYVSGCTAVVDGRVTSPGDPAEQARRAIVTGLAAVTELGGGVTDVVRTRVYLTHRQDADLVGRVHREFFAQEPPAMTMLVVHGLVDPLMRVEIEMDAVVDG